MFQKDLSALVFDFDDVVVQTSSLRLAAWQLAVRELGFGVCHDLPPTMVGRSDDEISSFLVRDPEAAQRLLSSQRAVLHELLRDAPPPLGDYL